MPLITLPSMPSRKSLIQSALFCAFFLLLIQACLGSLSLMLTTSFPSVWYWPWFVGVLVSHPLMGGVCALKTTRGLDQPTSVRKGGWSGLWTGFFGTLMNAALAAIALPYLISWINQAPGRSGWVVVVDIIFLIDATALNLACTLLAIVGGMIAGDLRARREGSLVQKERPIQAPAR